MVCPERLDDKSKTTLKQSLFTRGKIMKKINFRKIFPYNLKKMLPVLGIAGIGAVSSCEKPSPYQPAPAEVDVYFDYDNTDPAYIWTLSSNGQYTYEPGKPVQYYNEHPDVKTIYIVPAGQWNEYTGVVLQRIRPGLEMLFNYSPKVRGKGNFNLPLGYAAQFPEDSLWLVQHGWTINQQQNQH